MNMKVPFDYSAWIWCNREPKADEYGEFYSKFEYLGEERVKAVISADSNYALYVNGNLAAEGQYADYPYDKVYDELDLTDYCHKGENHLAIVVWYYGLKDSSTYYLGQAALRFAVWDGEACVCSSGISTQSRLSRTYVQHVGKLITGQLGLTFSYDATAEDDWMEGRGDGMKNSVLIRHTPKLRPRPCKKMEHLNPLHGQEIKRLEDGTILYDLGYEEVGFLSLDVHSKKEQTLIISYGEHIVDGRVRRKIGSRDFSVTYRAKEGANAYVNPFRRFACRYLEITAEDPSAISVAHVGIIPTMYPLVDQTPPPMSEVQKKIYDVCVRTLRLCMHEHYEDCPWREQSLYAMDSRNQIISGYHAFGEYEFPRAVLQLIAKDNREDGLLAICYPSSLGLAIPSFSLHFITEAQEYLQYTGDKELMEEIFPKMQSILKVFLGLVEGGVAKTFTGGGNPRYWNFYEWRPGLSGSLSKKEDGAFQDPHLVLNTLIICSLARMAWVARELGLEEIAKDYDAKREAMIEPVRKHFWREDLGVFVNRAGYDLYSQLGNSLAISAGLVEGEEAEKLAERIIADEEMTPISLSMQCFKYDALLKVDEEKYRSFILEDIEKIYVPMLDGGTGTVWETEIGESDFSRAGSLCHGWSAMPVYYYHKFLKTE